MKPLAVHHVSLNVSDVDAAVRFYTDVLGLSLRSDRPDFGFGGAWLDAGGQQVHLIQSDATPAAGQHFALQVEDLAEVVGELRGRGLEVGEP
ncbi:MAG TPA: VOC family protein, partial [Acidimicrobiales bacterium]|nr:VOC family protein [Acidimicrobiales bacterium]